VADQGRLGFFQVIGGYDSPFPFDAVWINNVSIAGADTHPDTKAFKVYLTPTEAAQPNTMYLSGNIGPHQTTSNQWGGVTFQGSATEASIKRTSAPSWHTAFNYAILPTSEVVSSVLANAGARPLDRDSVDLRIVRDVRQGTGRAIGSQDEVGGFPTLAQNRRTLTVPANPNEVIDSAGRTRIEAWLEGFARGLEAGAGSTVQPTAPANVRVIK
jgi:hypothetical protein